MDFYNKRIGIWGFGIVGKAALKALKPHSDQISVIDKRKLNDTESELLKKENVLTYSHDQLEKFLAEHDLILPSPGIDLRPYQQFSQKFISELDIFSLNFSAPIIAITGTVGKTTTTSLLAHVLEHAGYKVCVGGNIGIGMLDLLHSEEKYDYAVLEVSSFQLELSKFFSPHLAIWTNFYPNHLDRHSTIQEYFNAKQNILLHQKETDYAILPLEILGQLSAKTDAQRIFFSTHTDKEKFAKLDPADRIIAVDDKSLWCYQNNHVEKITDLTAIPDTTYQQNMLAIIAALTALKIPVEKLFEAAPTFTAHEHRLEKVTTINGVAFYNDSKSTIAQATIAAIDKLQGRPVLLLLGGLSKGVDRSQLFKEIHGKVTEIFCFGKEADALYQAGTSANIACRRFENLETALQSAVVCAKPGDQILFSPAGSSFDLFSNYQERGKRFKELVETYQQQKNLGM